MNFFRKIWKSNFLIRLRSWEYWPFGVVYAPIFPYWIWLSIKARSLLYFTASNPAIENGGMLGESKMKIFDLIPERYKPITFLFKPDESLKSIRSLLLKSGLGYPVIAKPDVGERGWMVRKLNSDKELTEYLEEVEVEFLIQEYLDLPLELGVFYYKYPGKPTGKVSSIVIKEMLSITGNGYLTVKELILSDSRAKLQWKALKKTYHTSLDHILQKGENWELVSIGNHSRGCKFLNGNYLINDAVHEVFDKIGEEIKGFYYGRYDIRLESYDSLYNGEIKIMELNGAGSEPAHIYNPGFSIWRAYKVIFHHWRVLYEISRINHKLGVPYLTLSEGWREYQKVRAIEKS